VLAFDAAALAAAGTDPAPLAEPVIGPDVVRTDGTRLVRHALSALAPRATAHRLLAARLGRSEAVIAALFSAAAVAGSLLAGGVGGRPSSDRLEGTSPCYRPAPAAAVARP
jgi:hypothetical protein